jgi:hypothetical protein
VRKDGDKVMTTRRRTRRRARSGRVAAGLAVALSLAAGAWAPGAESGSDAEVLSSTRDTIARWVEVQQILSRERQEWQLAREMLQERIALLEDEIAGLETKTDEARGGIAEAERKGRELREEDGEQREATETLAAAVGGLESRTVDLLELFPDPLRERVEPLAQRIPSGPGAGEASLGQRYQNVIGILNEANKFNQDLSVTQEFRTLPDGRTAEVTVLYLGLGQAYYVTSEGVTAGTGRPEAGGWSWTSHDDLADEISKALGILRNEEAPAYVPLPVVIR